MIYVCEYDGSAGETFLQSQAAVMPFDAAGGRDTKRQQDRRRERILAWLLLSYAVRREVPAAGEEPRDIFEWMNIKRDTHGRPYSASHPGLHFNLSHCGAACACILSEERAGIDIERRFSYRANLERCICHEEELAALKRMEASERCEWLRYLWSLKESYVKFDGRGLGYGMNRVNFSDMLEAAACERELPLLLRFEKEMSDATILHCMVKRAGTYTFAACSRSRQNTVRSVSERELMAAFRLVAEDD